MRKFLVVGVGGSGGATLRYLMDQLRADLRRRGIHELPSAWQFVHIDVKPVPESTPGLGDVRDLGGRYVEVGTKGNTFDSFRQSVESRLLVAKRLDTLVGCNPLTREQANLVSLETGAGQYRAIGRMLTLTRLEKIQNELNLAWHELQKHAAWGELPGKFPEEGPYDSASAVIPIVVGSMAGGSGASMCLDVCRLLGRIGTLNRRQLGMFLFTPEVFSSLDFSKRKGIDGNAMAVLGEVLAAQMGAADVADHDLVEALGLPPVSTGPERPFGRVIPIGSLIGGDGAKFGEVSEDIFRGLGRAIAATIVSEVASDSYVWTKFENPLAPTEGQQILGWGCHPDEVAWGSFGYASLSLGRDRYAHYAAQRLARTATDRLVNGYLNPTNPLPPSEQLDQLVGNQWPVILGNIGLPGADLSGKDWMRSGPLKLEAQYEVAHRIVAPSVQATDGVQAQNAGVWLNLVQQNMGTFEGRAMADLRDAAYAWVEKFAEELEARTVSEVLRVLAHPRQGLPFARRAVERLAHEVHGLAEKLNRAPQPPVALKLEPSVVARIEQAELGPEIKEEVRKGLVASVQVAYEAAAARRAAGVLTSFADDVLGALRRAISLALEDLDGAMKSTEREAGLAQLQTAIYNEWPRDSDYVPERFDHAENEVLLTTADVFPARFAEHIAASVPGVPPASAVEAIVNMVTLGQWETAGASRSSFDVMTRDSAWRAPELRTDARTGAPTPESKPIYGLALKPADILERAFAYQAQDKGPFQSFSSQTFAQYLEEPESDSARAARRAELVRRFEEATKQAYPLVGISGSVVKNLHGVDLQIELSFSAIPLAGVPKAVTDLRELLVRFQNLEQQTLTRFDAAITDKDASSRIAIYGSYPKYYPLVFSSFLAQLQDRWSRESELGKRELWNWKRTRAVPAAIGMSRDEQLALITGWYLGRALGLLHQPASVADVTVPVQVFDLDTGTWLKFATRQLTSREHYRAPDGYDWLPGILEGHTLALVNSANDGEFAQLRPYHALRRIFDAGLQPAQVDSTTADPLIAQWLTTGTWPSGEQSQIAALVNASPDIHGRGDALRTWVQEIRAYVEDQYIETPTGPGRESERRTKVPSTVALDGLSLFGEIALVCHKALGELLESIDRGLNIAQSKGRADAPPQV